MTKEVKYSIIRLILGIALYVGEIITVRRIELDMVFVIVWLLIVHFLFSYGAVTAWIQNIKKKKILEENLLMLIATMGAFGIGMLEEAVAVMLFFQVGTTFQQLITDRSKQKIAKLMDIRPVYATRKVKGQEIRVEPGELKLNHIIIIKPGERVPVDAMVTSGVSSMDTQAITGESIPRTVRPGDKIYSGSINLSAALEAQVIKEYQDSTVSRIIEMVERASAKKSERENFISRFTKLYTPVVVMLALAFSLGPIFVLQWDAQTWIYRGLIFLAAACPCAILMATPIAFLGGIAASAKRGIIVRGGSYLESLAKADIFVFDKTGTLTEGVFKVQEVTPSGISADELLEVMAHVECNSNHPIAKSLQDAYGKEIDRTRIKRSGEIIGCGIQAKLDDKTVYLGNAKLMRRKEIPFDEIKSAGTVVYAAIDGVYMGRVVISDEIRKDAPALMSYLRNRRHAMLVMLTGDTKRSGKEVGKKLGMDYIYTDLLPDEKVESLGDLLVIQDDMERVVFVGDGINDAPVLVEADVGIAMGALGSDAALDAADIILMDDEIYRIKDAIKIARETLRVVNMNFKFSLFVEAVILILTLFGLVTMWGAVFVDIGVMILAILNATWVYKYPV